MTERSPASHDAAAAAVIVVGSANADLIAGVPRRPAGGETVLAHGFERRAGGKGANQAAASARAGARTVFVGAVGDDPFGAEQLEHLQREGVEIGSVRTLAGFATGTALITVTPEGENSIVVIAGANGALTASMVLEDLTALADAAVVVVQTELASDVIDATVSWSTTRGIRVVLNNGPVIPLERPTVQAADPLIVNEHEARELCGPNSPLELLALVTAVRNETGAQSVVVTAGAAGAAVLESSSAPVLIPSIRAPSVVDTTGAGDAFAGTLAARLALGASLEDAARAAAEAATESVSWPGARPPHAILVESDR